MNAKNNQPDWSKIAEKFDIWLPHLAPVGNALLTALEVQQGDYVIDLASGTGEPALTLSRRMKGLVKIIGVDSADGMVRVAQAKVNMEMLSGISFHCMEAENLAFNDKTFDRALCRFGVMLFQNPLQGLKEIKRVLKPGGRFAFTVWSRPETMPTLYWSYEALKNHLPEDLHPPLGKATSLGWDGVLEGLLEQAGFAEYNILNKTTDYEFESFDAYWNTVEASDVLKQQFDALPPGIRNNIRNEVWLFARDFIHSGRLVIPHEYLLATGYK